MKKPHITIKFTKDMIIGKWTFKKDSEVEFELLKRIGHWYHVTIPPGVEHMFSSALDPIWIQSEIMK